jgi:hypothetical protein
MCCCIVGGMQVPVAQLLNITGAEVGLFAEQPATGHPPTAGALVQPAPGAAAAAAAAAALAAPLPLPWPAGSDMVRLVGVVAQKRR